MIIQENQRAIQRSGIVGERQFGIAMNAKVYSMMTDKLYHDRIGSTVREVCSNAWDAQKMQSIATGNPIAPFTISLPTQVEPHFIVTDTGPGMPDEVAQELYSNLGLSTKEGSNDQIGAFGLGSKSPFSVTDTFSVENTYSGVTHYYLCFKNEGGLPSLLKTGERIEDKPNGVKVIIPASGSNFNEYKTALMRQLIVMEPKPIITNINSFTFIDHLVELEDEDGFILTNCDNYNLRSRHVYAKMGMVLYPILLEEAGNASDGIHQMLGSNSCLILKFNIGDIEPMPSREALSYTNHTRTNICAVYHKFSALYKARLLEKIRSKTSPLDAYKEMVDIKEKHGIDFFYSNVVVNDREINHDLIKSVYPTFEHTATMEVLAPYSKPVFVLNLISGLMEESPPLTLLEDRVVTLSQFQYHVYIKRDLRLNIAKTSEALLHSSFKDLHLHEKGNIKILLMDELEPKSRISRLKSALNELSYNESYRFVKVNPNYTGSKIDFSEYIKSLEDMHPGISDNFLRLSAIPVPERAKPIVTVGEKILDGLTWTNGSEFESRFKKSDLLEFLNGDDAPEDELFARVDIESETNVSPIDRILYIQAFRNELLGYRDIAIKDILSSCHRLGITVIIVRASGLDKIKLLKSHGILEYTDFINTRMDGFVSSDDFNKRKSANLIYEKSSWTRYHYVNTGIQNVITRLISEGAYIHPLLKDWKEVCRLREVALIPTYRSELMQSIIRLKMSSYFKDNDWFKQTDVDLSIDWGFNMEHFNNTYPMFSYLIKNSDFHNGEELTRLVEYMVDYSNKNGLVV